MQEFTEKVMSLGPRDPEARKKAAEAKKKKE
jgi:hypothetical protein